MDDWFAQRWCAALDEVLAPVVGVLDCFAAYLDPVDDAARRPGLAGRWVGLDAAAALPLERRRELVADAA